MSEIIHHTKESRKFYTVSYFFEGGNAYFRDSGSAHFGVGISGISRKKVGISGLVGARDSGINENERDFGIWANKNRD